MNVPESWRQSWTVWAAIAYAIYRVGVALGLPAFEPSAEYQATLGTAIALIVAVAPSVAAIALRMRRQWFGGRS